MMRFFPISREYCLNSFFSCIWLLVVAGCCISVYGFYFADTFLFRWQFILITYTEWLTKTKYLRLHWVMNMEFRWNYCLFYTSCSFTSQIFLFSRFFSRCPQHKHCIHSTELAQRLQLSAEKNAYVCCMNEPVLSVIKRNFIHVDEFYGLHSPVDEQ